MSRANLDTTKSSPDSPVRVLLVEDHAASRQALVWSLELSGFLAVGVSSGAAALELLARDKNFDWVLLDLTLVDLDGVELARRIRPLVPNARVALMTGWASVAQPKHLETEAGIERIWQKPVEIGDLTRHLLTPRPDP